MKKFEDLLNKRDDEIEREKKAKADEEEARRQNSINLLIRNTFTFGLSGALIGAILGFGKGCKSYGDHYVGSGDHFSEPFIYILPNALTVCIIGAVIGIIVGYIKGQKQIE